MQFSSGRLIFATLVLVLACQIACLQAAALTEKDSPVVDGSTSEENDLPVQAKKDTDMSSAQQYFPSPHRRHYLKFGVLGKRFSYGYLGRRAEDSDARENNDRDRRAGRLHYGLLG